MTRSMVPRFAQDDEDHADGRRGHPVPRGPRSLLGDEHPGTRGRGGAGAVQPGAAPRLHPRPARDGGRLRLRRRRGDGAQAGAVLRGGGEPGPRASLGPIVLLSARGRRFGHDDAVRFSLGERLTLLCGHYKDVDQRVADGLATEELSVGDFVLSGGEPAALCVLDAVVRLLPGALGDHESASRDSHYDGLLSPPSYTRPPEYRGLAVPEVLRSGNHAEIAAWRQAEAERLTRERRPDLWEKYRERRRCRRVTRAATYRWHRSSGRRGSCSAQTHGALGAEDSTMERLAEVAREGLRTDIPAFEPGDTIRVMVRVREGDKERLQAFEGLGHRQAGRRDQREPSPSGRSRPASASSGSSRCTARRSPRSSWSAGAGCAGPSSTTSAR